MALHELYKYINKYYDQVGRTRGDVRKCLGLWSVETLGLRAQSGRWGAGPLDLKSPCSSAASCY